MKLLHREKLLRHLQQHENSLKRSKLRHGNETALTLIKIWFVWLQRKIFKKATNQTLVTVNCESHYNDVLLQHSSDANKNHYIDHDMTIPEDGRINYSNRGPSHPHGSRHVVNMLGKDHTRNSVYTNWIAVRPCLNSKQSGSGMWRNKAKEHSFFNVAKALQMNAHSNGCYRIKLDAPSSSKP